VFEQETNITIRYVMPLHFGDRISVETSLKTGNKLKLEFKYKIRNQDQKYLEPISSKMDN